MRRGRARRPWILSRPLIPLLGRRHFAERLRERGVIVLQCRVDRHAQALVRCRRDGDAKVTYGDIFLQAEQEYSRHNFEYADTAMLFEQFKMAEAACRKYLEDGWKAGHNAKRHFMALPAYDQCIKASHVFNLLDARGVISVTERQSYILRVRELAKACGEAWLATEGGGAA